MIFWDYKDYRISSLIIKSTDCCNLRCKYCYLKEKNTNMHKHISLKLVEKLMKDYFIYQEENDLDSYLYIVWHGGEPLICGLEFYEDVLAIERKLIDASPKKKRRIFNSVQTNGTLLSDEYCKFFKEHNFGVGLSIDGISKHNDKYRIYSNGSGCSKQIEKGIEKLHKYNIPFSAICVIHQESIGYEQQYYEYFKRLGVSEVDFIPSFFQNSPYNLHIEQYANFIENMFIIYLNDKDKTMRIRVLEDILRAILKSQNISCGSIGCEYAGRCGENLSISVNGDVYPCDCLENIDTFVLGNIEKMDFNEILSQTSFTNFKRMVNTIPSKCISCSVFDVCKGGCFNRRIKSFGLQPEDFSIDYYCEARKHIINFIMEKCYERI